MHPHPFAPIPANLSKSSPNLTQQTQHPTPPTTTHQHPAHYNINQNGNRKITKDTRRKINPTWRHIHLNSPTPIQMTHMLLDVQGRKSLIHFSLKPPFTFHPPKTESLRHQINCFDSIQSIIADAQKNKSKEFTLGDLRTGDLSRPIDSNDAYLILKALDPLEKITIKNPALAGCFIERLPAEKFSNLTELSICDSALIQEKHIQRLLHLSPKLKTLTLENLSINGECLSQDLQFTTKNPELQSITLKRCLNIQEEHFHSLHKLAPKLKTLTITECQQIEGHFLSHISQKSDEFSWQLTFIKISHCFLKDEAIQALFHLSDKIEHLDLRDTPISGQGFIDTYNHYRNKGWNEGLDSLKKIYLEHCTLLSPKSVHLLLKLSRYQLTTLSLAYTPIDDNVFSELFMDKHYLDKLEQFSLRGCQQLSKKGFHRALDIASKAKVLDISYTSIPYESFQFEANERPLAPVTTLKIAGLHLTQAQIENIADILQLPAVKTSGNSSTMNSFYPSASSSTSTSSNDKKTKSIVLEESVITKELQEKLKKRNVEVSKVKT